MLAVPFLLLLVLLLFVRVILVQLVLGPGVHFLRQEGFQSEPKKNVGFFFFFFSIDVFLGETVAFCPVDPCKVTHNESGAVWGPPNFTRKEIILKGSSRATYDTYYQLPW